jgi:hypothetical protein
LEQPQIFPLKELSMSYKKVSWLFLGILLLSVSLSCKHQQPVEDTPPEEPAVPAADSNAPDQAALDALSAAIDRVNNARKLVRDFNGPGYFPADFEAADALYTEAAGNEKKATLDEVRESTGRYVAAAEAFDALAQKTLPRYAAEKEAEILGLRRTVIDGEIERYGPEYLLRADNKALEARTSYESKDYYPARDGAQRALEMYRTINTGLGAYKTRVALMDKGFYYYDPQTVDRADETAREGLADYLNGDIAAAEEKAEEAQLRYSLVLNTGRALFAAENGAVAGDARQEALNGKANVAARKDFDAANGVYQKAAAAYGNEQYDEASALYADAAGRFEELIKVVGEKRRRAEEARQAAELKMLESDGAAMRAELILQGGM